MGGFLLLSYHISNVSFLHAMLDELRTWWWGTPGSILSRYRAMIALSYVLIVLGLGIAVLCIIYVSTRGREKTILFIMMGFLIPTLGVSLTSFFLSNSTSLVAEITRINNRSQLLLAVTIVAALAFVIAQICILFHRDNQRKQQTLLAQQGMQPQKSELATKLDMYKQLHAQGVLTETEYKALVRTTLDSGLIKE